MFLKELTSFLAALLFAVHPIHTEAVSFNILNRFIELVWNIYNFFVNFFNVFREKKMIL